MRSRRVTIASGEDMRNNESTAHLQEKEKSAESEKIDKETDS